MLSRRLWSGSTKAIFLPSLTHFFAQSGFGPVYAPDLARPPAQPSSESQPRRMDLSPANSIIGVKTKKTATEIAVRSEKTEENMETSQFWESTMWEPLRPLPSSSLARRDSTALITGPARPAWNRQPYSGTTRDWPNQPAATRKR